MSWLGRLGTALTRLLPLCAVADVANSLDHMLISPTAPASGGGVAEGEPGACTLLRGGPSSSTASWTTRLPGRRHEEARRRRCWRSELSPETTDTSTASATVTTHVAPRLPML